jgi:hypothetical protein
MVTPNPLEIKRIFCADGDCPRVCNSMLAEGKVLGANSLGGMKRSLWYDCGNWRSGSLTQHCAPARRSETGSQIDFCGEHLIGGIQLISGLSVSLTIPIKGKH